MRWYFSKDGQQSEPLSEDGLKAKIATGEVKANDLVWHEGAGGWEPASTYPQLGLATTRVSPPEKVAPAATVASGSPYQTPVSQPGRGVSGTGGDIPNFLWQSIAATLLCCPPLGIVAIIYASKVDGLKMAGDFGAARAASNSAKLWVNLSVGSILLLVVIVFVLNFIGVQVQ